MAVICSFTNCAMSGLIQELNPCVPHTFHRPQSDQIITRVASMKLHCVCTTVRVKKTSNFLLVIVLVVTT